MKILKLIVLVIFKYYLILSYFFIKLFTEQRNRVFFFSRQFNEVPYNYKVLIDRLNEDKIGTRVICKKVSSGLNSIIRNERKGGSIFNGIFESISYYFNLYKQMYYAASSKVIIVDGYNVVSSLLNHKKGTKVIQLWHALAAIKKFGYQTIGYPDGLDKLTAHVLCMHKNYDYIISGSVAMNKYFSEAFNTDIKALKAYATPMVDYLVKENNELVNKIYKKYPILKKKPNILYCPTFRSDGRNSLIKVIDAIDTKKYNLIVMLHPKEKIVKSNNNVIYPDRREFSSEDILRVCDYIISDYSAIIIEACAINVKVLLYLFDYEQYKMENGINIDLFKELKGNASEDINEIAKIIENDSYNMESYNKFKKKYLSVSDGTSTDKIIKLIKECL